MCVIVYKPKGVSIDEQNLEDCYASNPDGIGLMYQANGRVVVRKGLTLPETTGMVASLEGDVVLHFRLATSGDVDAANCHPFAITHDPDVLGSDAREVRAAIVHNGVMPKWVKQGSAWSDTARFVSKYLANIPRKTRDKALQKASKTTGGKFAMMSYTDVDMYGNWNEVDEVWYSNLHWEFVYQPYGFHIGKSRNTNTTTTDTSATYEWVDWEGMHSLTDDEPPPHTCMSCGGLEELVDGAYCDDCHYALQGVGYWS